ncbi:MAG TPA: hypothetical protein DHV96_09525 [Lachnospiraceae bacterium]|nr:hypothetical protein [Lachnospiraceae bacterium]
MRHRLTTQRMKKILQRDMEIPVIVTEQMAAALHEINTEYNEEESRREIIHYNKMHRLKQQVAMIALLCIIGFGAGVTATQVKRWKESAVKVWKTNAVVQDKMIEQGTAPELPEIVAEDAGVKISVEQIVTDGWKEHILFKVELPADIDIAGEWGFHTEMLTSSGNVDNMIDKELCNAVPFLQEKNVRYIESVLDMKREGSLKGESLTYTFRGLEQWDDQQNVESLVDGRWQLEIPADAQEYAAAMTETYEEKLDIGEDDIQVEQIIVSPISVRADIHYQHLLMDEVNKSDDRYWEVFPCITKVVMRDGTEKCIESYDNSHVYDIADEVERQRINKMTDANESREEIQKEKDWAVTVSVDLLEGTYQQENEVIGLIDPDEVQTLVFTYGGKEYSYKIQK